TVVCLFYNRQCQCRRLASGLGGLLCLTVRLRLWLLCLFAQILWARVPLPVAAPRIPRSRSSLPSGAAPIASASGDGMTGRSKMLLRGVSARRDHSHPLSPTYPICHG